MVFSWTIGTNPRRQLFGICGEVAIRGELFLYSWGRSTMKLESCIVKVLVFNLLQLRPTFTPDNLVDLFCIIHDDLFLVVW